MSVDLSQLSIRNIFWYICQLEVEIASLKQDDSDDFMMAA